MGPGRYVGVSIGYRPTGEASLGPGQIHDCKAAIRWLKAHAKKYRFDPDRIAVFGSRQAVTWFPCWGSAAASRICGPPGATREIRQSRRGRRGFLRPTDFLKMNDQPGKNDHNAARSRKACWWEGLSRSTSTVVVTRRR
ncbi:MAG: hypothetical protein Ct9H300mP1_37480 [Planctomycetaceae bacterium]|nr:MAG: hypothetical protein Ct9H300mP1_37480 [Planctomycetaceae bacterium]